MRPDIFYLHLHQIQRLILTDWHSSHKSVNFTAKTGSGETILNICTNCGVCGLPFLPHVVIILKLFLSEQRHDSVSLDSAAYPALVCATTLCEAIEIGQIFCSWTAVEFLIRPWRERESENSWFFYIVAYGSKSYQNDFIYSDFHNFFLLKDQTNHYQIEFRCIMFVFLLSSMPYWLALLLALLWLWKELTMGMHR